MEEKAIELETLQKDINTMLELNRRLIIGAGMCDIVHDTAGRNYLQADSTKLISTAKKLNLGIKVNERKIKDSDYPYEIVVPVLKMFGLATKKTLIYHDLTHELYNGKPKAERIAELEEEIKLLREEG
mgnify:CR=1 FL=1